MPEESIAVDAIKEVLSQHLEYWRSLREIDHSCGPLGAANGLLGRIVQVRLVSV